MNEQPEFSESRMLKKKKEYYYKKKKNVILIIFYLYTNYTGQYTTTVMH